MKKRLIVFLLLLCTTMLTSCVSWTSTGLKDPETWYTEYPLETGNYWVYNNSITIRNYQDGEYISTEVITRRDSVVVLGEEMLPNNSPGIHVVDYWSTEEDTGEIHHFYKQQNDGLYCLAVKYENGMDTYRDPIIPNMSFFIEMSPMPGHAVIPRTSYHEDGYTIEMPARKVLENEYVQEDSYWDNAYGPYFDHSTVNEDWYDFRIWEVCIINKEYYIGNGRSLDVEDFLAEEGIVKRQITLNNIEVLDEEGEGKGLFRRYNVVMEMVD